SRDGSVLLTTVLLNDEDSGEYDNSLEKPLAQVHHTMRSLFELRSEGLSDLGRQVAYDNRAVFVDGLGRVIHVGRRAEAALRMGWVDVKNTRLVACDADQQRKLDARLEAATTARVLGSEPCKVLLRDQEGGFGGVATVYTLGQAHNIDLFGRQPRAVVILKPNSGDPLELADLREELGLTGAEAALAADLVSGKTVAEHANGRAISSETARGTLKQVFEKVGVSRQPELVRLISRLWDESC
ncbi:MAG: helix-turn-helix transcriptional regulator, partial [Pseudomonadota bacterium]